MLKYLPQKLFSIYKLGYVKCGSTSFKVQKDGCGVPSAARALLGPEEKKLHGNRQVIARGEAVCNLGPL